MRQFELNEKHRLNPAAGDSWSNWTESKLVCFVLQVLDNGNVVLTTKVNHEWDGKEFDISDAREVTKDEFVDIVLGDVVDVHPYPEHYLLKSFESKKKSLEKTVEAHVDHRITGRYIVKMEARGFEPVQHPEGSYLDGDHLLWMLYQIHQNKLSSQTKAHRWLGFIQCSLCVLKIVNLNEEREFTRDIFKGA